MIEIFDSKEQSIAQLTQTNTAETSDYAQVVQEIIDTVRQNGDAALIDYSAKFDQATVTELKVTDAEIEAALAQVDPDFLKVLELSLIHI